MRSEAFWEAWVAMCERLKVDPFHVAMVAYSESGFRPDAFNASGPAGGIVQFMQIALNGVGFPGTPWDMSKLSDLEQLPWVEKFYVPVARHCTSPAMTYLVNFLPGYVAQVKANPSFALGRRDGSGYDEKVYRYNRGLDANGDGIIDLFDLGNHLDKVCRGTQWNACENGIRKAMGLQPVPPTRSWRDPDAIREVQSALNALGESLKVDGLLGPKTDAAVTRFQTKFGLVADGLPGPKTRKALGL